MLEYWNIGILGRKEFGVGRLFTQYSIIPPFHYSNTK
jgi:hypothetical protein